MHQRLARIALWLFVINLGIAFGAGIYETRIEAPRWLHSTKTPTGFDAREARVANSGLRFWMYVTTIPLTLLTVASFAAVRYTDHETRKWWLIAAFAAMGDRIIAFGYSIPTLVELTAGVEPNPRAAAFQWAQLNWLRQLMLLAAWLAALRAFACFGRPRRHRHTAPQAGLPRQHEEASALSEAKLRA
jgi:hypothetical protein